MDLLETMFRDLDIEDLEPEQFESSSTKALHQEATKPEEASVATEHSPIPSDAVTHVMVISTPIPIEFGIPKYFLRPKISKCHPPKPSQKGNTFLLWLQGLLT